MNFITKPKSSDKCNDVFLPDFCHVYTVFLGIIVTELLAFVFMLVPLSKAGYDWDYVTKELIIDLAMLSLFIQWITLVSMGLLCLVRYQLCRLGNDIVAGIISYLLILFVTLGVSEFAWQLDEYVLSAKPTLNTAHHLLFLLRNLGISAIISAIALRYFYIQYQWKKQMEANAYAQAQALQARIRPHFLFNSMNTIASLIRFQPEKAEQAVEDFADLFRASLNDAKTYITFSEELALCQQYLRIEALRLGERLQIVWEVDNIPKNAILPLLCLQPLLENAIYHGIQPLSEGGTITITGLFDGKHIKLNIKNPLDDIQSKHQGHHMAQQNIHQRLYFFYGLQAKLIVQKNANMYTVTINFPYKNQSDENYYRR
ncbi:histidine kinase [Candidatus Parabeggiatoa sp. HSG14]|uniref:sensor histidine kinase n=1 Tax=Candidatus Parabeggiatoa sp. HSG14 TaxID=3055593 RepID=UPI0025A7BCBD|nr:histidine kinase [Thiotrichales bacterium HSG14]